MCARVLVAVSSVDKYTAEALNNIPERAFYIIKAIDAGFTASLSVRGKYVSDT